LILKAATVQEIKKELGNLEPSQVQGVCLRLARFKKENKELLTYLLFEANDEHGYVENVKRETTEQFVELSNLSVYFVKKSLRRILRMVNRQIKYSGLPATDLALRIHFCQQIKEAELPIGKSAVLVNLYQQQLKKINLAQSKLEEDLQYDYQSEIESLKL
jgi:glycerophosphoryl diester phosphodiesterase